MIEQWMNELDDNINVLIKHEAPVLRDIVGGSFSASQLVPIALRHYAEVRTFIDIKLPSRMRLCPFEDHKAKEYFCRLYIEEQGDFKPGKNHADLFAGFCRGVGISDEAMETEYKGYWPNYSYLLVAQPSAAITLSELSISYAWESMIRRISGPLTKLVEDVAASFSLTTDDLRYFPGHIQLDEEHEEMARDALATYATTDQWRSFIMESVRRTLVDANPWVLPLHPSAAVNSV